MKKGTHEIFNTGVICALCSVFCRNPVELGLCCVLGFVLGPLNDRLDYKIPFFQRMGHRNKFTHGFYIKVVLVILVSLCILILIFGFNLLITLILIPIASFLTHIGVDSITHTGVTINSVHRNGFIHYKNSFANGLLICLGSSLAIWGFNNLITGKISYSTWPGLIGYFVIVNPFSFKLKQ